MRMTTAVLLAAVLIVSACSVPLESEAHDLSAVVPNELLPANVVAPTTTVTPTEPRTIFLVRTTENGFRLEPVVREVEGSGMTAILETLLTTTALPSENLITQISGAENITITPRLSPVPGAIDLTLSDLEPLTSQDVVLQTVAFAQLVCTTLFNNVGLSGVRVLSLQEGQAVPVAIPVLGDPTISPEGETVDCYNDYAGFFLPDPEDVVTAISTTTVG